VSHIDVGSEGVTGVRIGSDNQAAPTTRVVVDLLHKCQYELVPGADGKLTVKLHLAPAVAKTVAPLAALPIARKSVALAKLPEPISTVPAPVTAAPASANNFVFVEPSYQPKPATDVSFPAVTERPARAALAAAKFVERPDTNLLPAPSASMQAAAATAKSPAPNNLAAEQKAQLQQQAPVMGPKYTGEPISVNLKDVDLKDFFRLIHEISGLNVVLDPNVHGTLTIVLDDVPWDQALDIVLKNNDLSRQLDGNVLRIATVDTL
jgi:type IV pilus assembly protein PilQ